MAQQPGQTVFAAQAQHMPVIGAQPQLQARVAAQMLVGHEEHGTVGPGFFQGPGQHGAGIGRGADRPAEFAHHGLERQGGVHIGQGHDLAPCGLQLQQYGAGEPGRRHERHHAVGR